MNTGHQPKRPTTEEWHHAASTAPGRLEPAQVCINCGRLTPTGVAFCTHYSSPTEHRHSGVVSTFNYRTRRGTISCSDGQRYELLMANWQEKRLAPRVGLNVSFNSDGSNATYVTREKSRQSVKSKKSKIAAGLFAIFLGAFGVHKFYLGYIVTGFFHPTIWVLGILATDTRVLGILATDTKVHSILLWFLLSGIIPLVEGIIYLTKSDEDFHQIYVANRRALF